MILLFFLSLIAQFYNLKSSLSVLPKSHLISSLQRNSYNLSLSYQHLAPEPVQSLPGLLAPPLASYDMARVAFQSPSDCISPLLRITNSCWNEMQVLHGRPCWLLQLHHPPCHPAPQPLALHAHISDLCLISFISSFCIHATPLQIPLSRALCPGLPGCLAPIVWFKYYLLTV